MKGQKTIEKTTLEDQASILGSGLIGFGLGILVSQLIISKWAAIILLFGIGIHGWGMWRTYKRNS